MNSLQNNKLMPDRYFFALSPDLRARMQIQHIMKRLPETLSLKLQATANLHQTLLFLGQLEQQQVNALVKLTESVRCAAIHMQFDHLFYWANPKIFCLTSRAPSAELFDLVNQLQRIARETKVEVDVKSYQPHITLARKANEVEPIPIAPVQFEAKELVLMKSVATEQGLQYQSMMHWPLTDNPS